MENNIRKTIGIIIMIVGAIILLSGLGLNLKFFAVAETTISSYDGKYVHIPFSGGERTELYPYYLIVNINPTTSLTEEICNKIGLYNEGTCILYYNKLSSFKSSLSPTSACNFAGQTIKIYSQFDIPEQDVIRAWIALSDAPPKPAIQIGRLPSDSGVICSGEILVDVTTQTCSELKGNKCAPTESCSGMWLTASDAPKCCSGSCITPIIQNCNDKIQNQGETGVDCGGPCPACVVECLLGQEKCEGATSSACENNKWVSKGQVSGKCGIALNVTLVPPKTEATIRVNTIALIFGILGIGLGIFMWRKNVR